jgi:hypothetical protein
VISRDLIADEGKSLDIPSIVVNAEHPENILIYLLACSKFQASLLKSISVNFVLENRYEKSLTALVGHVLYPSPKSVKLVHPKKALLKLVKELDGAINELSK